jgi:hypothetical protein
MWLTKALTLNYTLPLSISRLQSWRAQTAAAEPSFNWPGVNNIIKAQYLAGWQVFLEGAVLQDWAAKQKKYYKWLQRKNTGKRWITALITKLWEIS